MSFPGAHKAVGQDWLGAGMASQPGSGMAGMVAESQAAGEGSDMESERGEGAAARGEATKCMAPSATLPTLAASARMSSTSVASPETSAPTETESTTTPGASSVGQAPGAVRSVQRTEAEREIDEHFRHIVCVLCHPEFEGTRVAPHDAVCICGKRLLKGDKPGPASAPQCILCNEMWDHHLSVAHGRDV